MIYDIGVFAYITKKVVVVKERTTDNNEQSRTKDRKEWTVHCTSKYSVLLKRETDKSEEKKEKIKREAADEEKKEGSLVYPGETIRPARH